MKKSLLALAVLGSFAGAAAAQSSVTIYGILDAGIVWDKHITGADDNWRLQSGQQYGRTMAFTFPGDGARTFRVEPITANRYPNISILDLCLDKSFTLPRQVGKVTFQIDGFNLANSGAPTLFRTTTVNYREVTELLSPRIFRVGFRWDF